MLLTGRNLAKSYGPRRLFSGITLGLNEGERIGLIGVNGSGKSTLLRIFAGVEQPDEGELINRRGLRVGYVAQQEAFAPGKSCLDILADATDDHLDDHERHLQAQRLLDKLGFANAAATAESLSGGWRKRLAIACALAGQPDLLLMDEPTNHLDVEGIIWLEQLLAAAPFATLIVTHDRRFLESFANRIIELGRAYREGFLSHNGRYSDFLIKREEFLAAQQSQQQSLASGVRREIEWLKRGAKARTTKAKGRIERAGEMIDDLADLKSRNTQQGAARVDFTATGRQTRKLIQLKHVGKSLGGKPLFTDVSIVLSPGDKLALLGPNGSGKSTLIKVLAGELPPDRGEVFRADQLNVVVLDQHRQQLDPTLSLRRALSPAGDVLSFNGSSMHISGWAKRFLFRTEQLDLPVSELSGGEQARVLIARLMLRPADVLVLDEPTNDLDIATLEVLEQNLDEFPGALVLVTHDRFLMQRIDAEVLALDGRGGSAMFADLSQWESAGTTNPVRPTEKKSVIKPPATPSDAAAPAKKRLTWKEQKELEGIEPAIHAAEAQLADLHTRAADPTIIADH
ncbi:MAG TPA: ABC-F family ATP-binding cassette domain-containing protein, partial [Tepidisphaeraceae bacterium]|nr:ABC-F family ATP-binding cassette domain-containing protein [Tepidisphaeraceae bacterium]